jgi:RimJ/RimL family protein N-acetyltransferase
MESHVHPVARVALRRGLVPVVAAVKIKAAWWTSSWHAGAMTHPTWPLFDLRVTTPRLELRYLDDDLGTELAELAAKGIHDPDYMPFGVPWSDIEPPLLQRNAMQWYWRRRAELTPAHWSIMLAAIVDGVVVGTSELFAGDFLVLRQFTTGSWLGRAYQGQGLGKEMRAASLHLGFAGLGAEFAATGAWADNGPSLAVTRSLGYEPEGRRRMVRRDEAAEMHGFRMAREHWERTLRRDDIVVEGLEDALPLLGL